MVGADLSYLPPELRIRQVMSWCPFCHLGWKDQSGGRCLIGLPTGSVMAHVPAVHFDNQSDAAKLTFMFAPRPWEAARMMRAGVDPRTMRREVPGLKRALEVGREVNKLVRRGHSRSAATTAVRALFAHREQAAAVAS